MEIDPDNLAPLQTGGARPHFWGKKEPLWELDKEEPFHKLAAFAFSKGATIRDVARALGKSEPTIQNLLRHKLFQEQVVSMMAESGGGNDILEQIRGEQFNSLITLVEMRDNPKVSAASRITCARDILDRALGKAVQRVETANIVASEDPVAEVERLEREVDRLRPATASNETQRS